MILRMERIRILGPRDRVDDVLEVLQDLEVMHLSPAGRERKGPGGPARLEGEERGRRRQQLKKAADVIGRVVEELGSLPAAAPPGPWTESSPKAVAGWLRLARTTLHALTRLRNRSSELERERSVLERYRSFFTSFEPLLERVAAWPDATAYHVILEAGAGVDLGEVRDALDRDMEGEYEMWSQKLPSGGIALIFLVRSSAAGRMDEVLSGIRVQEIEIPDSVRARTPGDAVEQISRRLKEIPEKLEAIRRERKDLSRERGPELSRARAAVEDRIIELDALSRATFTTRAFVLEGWIPSEERTRTERALHRRAGEEIVVEEVGREEWAAEQAPVVLHNPRLFRPFEAIVELLPLPRYGTMDPTPFVAVFFPMFFGLILGDVGYGTLLALLSFVLYRRSKPGTVLRSAAQIGGACAAFAAIFGFLFGELFGDLGRMLLGLKPLLFDREEALLPFLGLAVALGVVHLLLGLILNVLSAFRREGARKAVGPGLTLLMVVVILLALLAAFKVLPGAFFTPAVVVALVAFPVLVVLEGLVAPVELLSTMGRMLSYARIMALGTASVMMAVAANRMIGELGSVMVGVLFALIFHAVNFVLGVFSPTIHALRLHYVEFFGTFYSPGGTEYRPFRHWKGGGDRGEAGSDASSGARAA